MLEKLTTKELTEVVVTVIHAYHMREADRCHQILEACGKTKSWHEFWPDCLAKAEDEYMALADFTELILDLIETSS